MPLVCDLVKWKCGVSENDLTFDNQNEVLRVVAQGCEGKLRKLMIIASDTVTLQDI